MNIIGNRPQLGWQRWDRGKRRHKKESEDPKFYGTST